MLIAISHATAIAESARAPYKLDRIRVCIGSLPFLCVFVDRHPIISRQYRCGRNIAEGCPTSTCRESGTAFRLPTASMDRQFSITVSQGGPQTKPPFMARYLFMAHPFASFH
jgi:hypothetical protein